MFSKVLFTFLAILCSKTLKFTAKNKKRKQCFDSFAFIYLIQLLLSVTKCAALQAQDIITFGLIDRCWSCNLYKNDDYKSVKYWLACGVDGTFRLCPGNHDFIFIQISDGTSLVRFFSCPKNINLYNHKPLHTFRIIYLNRWNVKFRVLNNLFSKESVTITFIFDDYLKVYYQDFHVIDHYLYPQFNLSFHNLPYKLFYKILGIMTALDPISNRHLNQVYSNLLNNGLMGFEGNKILEDPNNYKKKYLKSKKHAFMYFFSVLNDSIGACLIRKHSMVYIFKRTAHFIDQCFKDVDNFSFLTMKLTMHSLKIICNTFSDFEWSIFNWLLSITNISGFYFDELETVYYGIETLSLYNPNTKDYVKKFEGEHNTVDFLFFQSLSSSNFERIIYLRFDNTCFSLDAIASFFRNKKLSHFELSYCTCDETIQISEILIKNSQLNTLKLRGMVLCAKDIDLILRSKIKYLHLLECTVETCASEIKEYTFKPGYRILKTLTSLDISFSKLPVSFVGILLNADFIGNINISSFEFLEDEHSPISVFSLRRKLNFLKIVNSLQNEYLLKFFMEIESVHTLVLSKISNIENLGLLFLLPGFYDFVLALDLSYNKFSAQSFNLLSKFNRVSSLNLENSLPLNIDEINDLPLFDTVEDLNLAKNEFRAFNNNFISRFQRITKLNLSNSKFRPGALINILNDRILNCLLYLDLSGIGLENDDFERVCEFKTLKFLAIDLKIDFTQNTYLEFLMFSPFKLHLNILMLEVKKIRILDFLNLAVEFPNLKNFRLLCEELLMTPKDCQNSYFTTYNTTGFCCIELLHTFPIPEYAIAFLQTIPAIYSISFFYHPQVSM
ncbi:hypothetical protein CWI39_0284p0020 [Hamiltosporidium magnivora]|uniref:Uncharacterized protein n=1 Tax=Hamiltosporidium magnivora TaxID=148818 RepID=A0A4Q9LI81_9MICR|nr:hypothetical protein CWI39_0284p0020 [Hamiltosporidium magnivora]